MCCAVNSIAVPTWNMRYRYPNAAWINPSLPASIAAYASPASSNAKRVGGEPVEGELGEQADDGAASGAHGSIGCRGERESSTPGCCESSAGGGGTRRRAGATRPWCRTTRQPGRCPRGRAARTPNARRPGCPTPRPRSAPASIAPTARSAVGQTVDRDRFHAEPGKAHRAATPAVRRRSTRAPARWSMSAVNAPTTPRPSTTTVSPSSGPASSVICNAVSTSGNSVAYRGVDGAEGDDIAGLGDKRVLMGLEGEHQPALRRARTGSPRRRRRSCTRSGTDTGTSHRALRSSRRRGSSGSSSPRYASISVPALMPENDVRTSTSPSPSGWQIGSTGCRPDEGPRTRGTGHSSSAPVCQQAPVCESRGG